MTVLEIVSGDTLVLEQVEAETGDVEAYAASIRDVMKLGGQVELAAKGSLPNDGKVIDDQRVYET